MKIKKTPSPKASRSRLTSPEKTASKKKTRSSAKKTAGKKKISAPVKKASKKKTAAALRESRIKLIRTAPDSRKNRIEKDLKEIKDQTAASLDLAKAVYRHLDEKKARDIKILNLEKVNPYFCYFVIASADSSVQLKAYTRDLRKLYGHLMPKKGSNPQEDDVSSGWVVLDFFDVVVHLFLKEERSYYNLERLWGDAPEVQPD